MKSIYYLDKALIFGTASEIEALRAEQIEFSDCLLATSAEQTKVELFSDNTKPVALISTDPLLEFQRFIATFDTIEAGGGVVRNPRGETLMIYRNGRWDLPKGKLEDGERIEQCALREVEEECNLIGLRLGDFRTHSYHLYELNGGYVLKKTWWWNMFHSGEGELKPQIEEGITDVCWVGIAQMPELLANTYATIREVLKES